MQTPMNFSIIDIIVCRIHDSTVKSLAEWDKAQAFGTKSTGNTSKVKSKRNVENSRLRLMRFTTRRESWSKT